MEGKTRKKYLAWLSESLKNERAYGANRKPLILRRFNRSSHRTGVTHGKISETWPTVKWCSTLG